MLYFSKIYYSGLAFLFLCLFIYWFICFVSRGITNFEIIFQGLVAWIWVMSTNLSAKNKKRKATSNMTIDSSFIQNQSLCCYSATLLCQEVFHFRTTYRRILLLWSQTHRGQGIHDKTDKKSTTLSMFNNGSVDSRTSLQAQFSLWLSICK